VIHLVPPSRDDECERLTLKLLREVRHDEIAGLVVITMFKRDVGPKRYHLRTASLANDDPTLALGALNACRALLERTALREAGFDL